jgi:hypothetical protein
MNQTFWVAIVLFAIGTSLTLFPTSPHPWVSVVYSVFAVLFIWTANIMMIIWIVAQRREAKRLGGRHDG